jgi:hypothetical protein
MIAYINIFEVVLIDMLIAFIKLIFSQSIRKKIKTLFEEKFNTIIG